MKKEILNKHDKMVWDIVLSEILKLKPKPNKNYWFKFKLRRREFIVYRR